MAHVGNISKPKVILDENNKKQYINENINSCDLAREFICTCISLYTPIVEHHSFIFPIINKIYLSKSYKINISSNVIVYDITVQYDDSKSKIKSISNIITMPGDNKDKEITDLEAELEDFLKSRYRNLRTYTLAKEKNLKKENLKKKHKT